MKIFLSADIEGTCGITDWSETERSTPKDYNPFQRQMTREVCAACEGAIAAGAKEVFIKDAHDSARNLDVPSLPQQIRILRGWTGDPLTMMSGVDSDDFDAVFFTGYHAWASCPGNPPKPHHEPAQRVCGAQRRAHERVFDEYLHRLVLRRPRHLPIR